MFASDDPALTAGLFDRFAQSALAGHWPADPGADSGAADAVAGSE
jgi:hypothetical protein